MNNTLPAIALITIICFVNLTNGICQSNHTPLENKKKTSQTQLADWRNAYAEAVSTKDTMAIYDNAYEILLYHSNTGNYDSIYFYNEVLLKVALHANDVRLYVDAHRANHFMDSKMHQQYEKAKKRVDDIRQYLDHEKLDNEDYYNITEILAGHFNREGNLDSTIYFQKMALLYSDKIGHSHINYITARVQIALYLNMFGRSSEAIKYLTEVEGIFATHPPSAMVKINFYHTMCATLINIKETAITESYIEKLEQLVTENNYKSYVSRVYNLKAMLASIKEDHSQAITLHNSALGALKKSGIKTLKPWIWANLGMSYYKNGEVVGMKRYLDSLEINYDKLIERNKFDYHELKFHYSLEKKKYGEARISLDFANNYNKEPTPERLRIAKLNYLYYQNTGATNKELNAYKSYVSLKDSLSFLSNTAMARRIESEFNREKQDIKIDALTETTTAQDKAIAIRNNALLMGSIMLLILAALLYGLYRLYKQNQLQTVRITKALEDNQMLIKEIHHRVKNNLQVVSSLLSMQARKIDDGDMKQALNSSMTRVQSMSILHQNLYSGTNPKDVEVDAYFDKLVENILSTYNIDKDVKFDVDIDNMAFDIDVMVPLGLIANELITNALKYAFDGRPSGNLSVSLKENGNQIVLCVADDGVGFDGNELPVREGSIGTRLIKSFTKKLKGDLQITHEKGTEITIVFDKLVLDGGSNS